MKIKDLDFFDPGFNSKITEVEFTKSGLKKYYEENDKIVMQVVLRDYKGYVHIYEKNGTYPFNYADGEKYYEPTGKYRNKPKGRLRGKRLMIFALCENNFDCINFFENEKDLSELFRSERKDERVGKYGRGLEICYDIEQEQLGKIRMVEDDDYNKIFAFEDGETDEYPDLVLRNELDTLADFFDSRRFNG